jgi:hypothetical protein
LPEHQQEDQACDQYIGAAFQQRMNDSGPAALEPGAGHYAVLNGKQAEQESVYYKSPSERITRCGAAVVYCPRDYLIQVAYESDGVQESTKENQVTGYTVEKSKSTFKHLTRPPGNPTHL